ncbi:MAG TPA: nickel pincer cofactor biosynthesis protein LarC [Pseudomonadales bacterium]|jgi:uncharacterized protein (TIGR00299 family) protein
MRTLYYDCFSGISGDMHIGAMVDVGVPVDYLATELDKLCLADEFRLQIEPASKMGIAGTKATVVIDPARPQPPARHLADVRSIIESAGYEEPVATTALGIFQRIADAEALVHGTTPDKVHFHEVGATDSIVDIVAAAVCIHQLAVDRVMCGPIEVGSGVVRCAHGIMPVPAPATALLLEGVPCHFGRVDGEATTPTGAAILREIVDDFQAPRNFRVAKLGYGIGQKDFSVPNVLRVMLGEEEAAAAAEPYEVESNLEVECNIDDMSAEAFQPLVQDLLDAGAKDVFLTPVIMKKSRPGTKVTVLVGEERFDATLEALFAGSTTIGARVHRVEKRMLPREARRMTTSLGEVRIKLVTRPDGRRTWKVEHDDLVALAERHAMSYLDVRHMIEVEARRELGDS